MVVVENSPLKFGTLNLNITWSGHVTKKPKPPLNSLGAKYPMKRFKLISWEFSWSSYLEIIFFCQISMDFWSLKSSYLLMAAVGGLLIGLNRRRKMSWFILDRYEHRTLSNTLEIWRFLMKIWFSTKIYGFLKIFFRSKDSLDHFTYGRGVNLR